MQKRRIKAATTPAATKHYIWLGDTPLAVFDGANLFYVHPDNLDRPVMMTNSAAQTVAWQAKYDPFGNPVTVTVAPVNNLRLPGHWFQLEDGLAYNWHRTYDASLGRYSQADPLGFVDGPSVYGYAGGSPLMGVDPRGLIELPSDPSGLPDGWVQDPQHKPRNGGGKFYGPAGGCLEFHPGRPGAGGDQDYDHWHDCTEPGKNKRRNRHRNPGEICPLPEDDVAPEPAPFTPLKPEPWWVAPLLFLGTVWVSTQS